MTILDHDSNKKKGAEMKKTLFRMGLLLSLVVLSMAILAELKPAGGTSTIESEIFSLQTSDTSISNSNGRIPT